MKSLLHRPLGAIVLSAAAALSLLAAGTARADDDAAMLGPGYWRLTASPFSQHFRYSAEHRYVWAVGIERQRSDDWLAGASYFSNSFGQPSAYLYVGKRFNAMFGQPSLFAQLSGGMLYGYRGKYEDKVPLNHNGFSPGALVSMGWQLDKKLSITAHMLGDAGVMVQLAYDLN